jgi:hypothetical protein
MAVGHAGLATNTPLLQRLLTWRTLAVAAVTAIAWYLGQSGWIAAGPNERFGKIESVQSDQAIEIETQGKALMQLQESVGFVTELLCQPVLTGPNVSQGDRYLQTRCKAELRLPP